MADSILWNSETTNGIAYGFVMAVPPLMLASVGATLLPFKEPSNAGKLGGKSLDT